jgi:ABC-type nitrate/sulfonate/bicarbonate transport system permease component
MSGWHYAPLSATGGDRGPGPGHAGGGRPGRTGRAHRVPGPPAGPAPRPDQAGGDRAAGLAALLVLWQVGAAVLRDQVALPSVGQTAAQFVHYLGRPYPAQGKPLWFDLYISLRRILIGFVIGVTIGVAVGAAMSGWRFARHLIDPVIEVILPKEVLIIVGIIPIMAVTTVAALDEVPEDLRLCARTLGATRRYTLLHVQIRAALPGILTGMRISMAGAWSSIVAVELLAATSGLGFMIMQAGDYLNTALVFAGIITIALAGLILDGCLRGLLILADPSRRR